MDDGEADRAAAGAGGVGGQPGERTEEERQGEREQGEQREQEIRRVAEKVTGELMAKGLLISAGWVMFETMFIPKQVHEHQHHDMRTAFFAGAQHLWSSIMYGLDEGREPSPLDIRKMDAIDEELKTFSKVLTKALEKERKRRQAEADKGKH